MKMKCFIRGPMLVFLLSSCFAAAYAQDSKIAFGGRVGINFSYITDNFRLEGGNPGLLLGGVVNYNLSDAMQLTGGIDYNQVSGSIKSNPYLFGSRTVVRENNLTLHTFEANGMFGYKLPLDFLGDASPYLQGGAGIAYNAGTWNNYTARYITPGASEPIEVRGTENVRGVATDFIATWAIGLRFEAPLEGLFSKMLLDFRLKSSMDAAVRPYTFNGSTKELGVRSISMSIGFIF